MRNIFKSTLGRASVIFAIVGLALFASGATAEARNGYWDHGHHWHYYAPVHRWWHGPYYGYRYYGYYAPYYAPPVVYGPPAYYVPPGVNFNFSVPLG